MKNTYQIFLVFICAFVLSINNSSIKAQSSNIFSPSFHKGSLLIGISEGNGGTIYTTKKMESNSSNTHLIKRGGMSDCRDPLFIEYGISNHWGLGFTSGKDIFTLNPNDYYGFKITGNKPITTTTGEFTFDATYHVFTNRRLDLAVYTNIGVFSVSFNGKDNDANTYQYKANGNIIRVGTRARYYFFRHLGIVGMISSFAGHASPQGVKDNTIAQNDITNINGFVFETGFCYRFFK